MSVFSRKIVHEGINIMVANNKTNHKLYFKEIFYIFNNSNENLNKMIKALLSIDVIPAEELGGFAQEIFE